MQLASNSDIALLLIKKASEIEQLETPEIMGKVKKSNENGTISKEQQTPGIMGKKAFQKSLYFLNQHRDFFKFKWGDYGPLSAEIQQIAEDLKANGQIIVKEIPTEKQGAIIQNMTFSQENNTDFSEIEFPLDLEDLIIKVTKFVRCYRPRDLELFASVHYWAKKEQFFADEYTAEYIYDKLLELKPDAGFTMKNVKDALGTLEFQEYLSPGS